MNKYLVTIKQNLIPSKKRIIIYAESCEDVLQILIDKHYLHYDGDFSIECDNLTEVSEVSNEV